MFELSSKVYLALLDKTVEADFSIVVIDAQAVLEDLNLIPCLFNINNCDELYSVVGRELSKMAYYKYKVNGIDLED